MVTYASCHVEKVQKKPGTGTLLLPLLYCSSNHLGHPGLERSRDDFSGARTGDQSGQGFRGGKEHFLREESDAGVEGAAKNTGENEHVVKLIVRVAATAGCNGGAGGPRPPLRGFGGGGGPGGHNGFFGPTFHHFFIPQSGF